MPESTGHSLVNIEQSEEPMVGNHMDRKGPIDACWQ